MDELYSIGDISKIVRISTDTLRYYDEIGLLEPYLIDPKTRYRFYTKEQVNKITRILELKQFGFPLKSIIEIEKNLDKSLIDIFKTRYLELEMQCKSIMKSMNKLSDRINQIEEGVTMKKNILIVDDATIMRSMLSEMFQREGYEIAGCAENGKEGVELYEKLNPDVVVLDISMPEMNGVDALIKIIEYDENAKIIMCSAMGTREIVLKCFMHGAMDFVAKPFISNTLFTAIEKSITNQYQFSKANINKMIDLVDDDDVTLLLQDEIQQIKEIII